MAWLLWTFLGWELDIFGQSFLIWENYKSPGFQTPWEVSQGSLFFSSSLFSQTHSSLPVLHPWTQAQGSGGHLLILSHCVVIGSRMSFFPVSINPFLMGDKRKDWAQESPDCKITKKIFITGILELKRVSGGHTFKEGGTWLNCLGRHSFNHFVALSYFRFSLSSKLLSFWDSGHSSLVSSCSHVASGPPNLRAMRTGSGLITSMSSVLAPWGAHVWTPNWGFMKVFEWIGTQPKLTHHIYHLFLDFSLESFCWSVPTWTWLT